MALFRRKPAERAPSQRLFYASDVHGSERCWRKFLGAARFYEVSALVMGGDLTGKAIVPIHDLGAGRYTATFMGERHRVDRDGLEPLLESVRFNGMYPLVASLEEITRLAGDLAARESVFDATMLAELERWVGLTDERMADRGVGVFVIPGNDDPWACDAVLRGASHLTACDHAVVRVGAHEMISCAHANPTPWESPRELPEDALYDHLRALAEQLEDPHRAIFNFHVPPHDTGLDRAVLLNDDLTPQMKNGQPVEGPVGSRAVRQVIEDYQPLLSLHGHIHESRNAARLGRTVALNSGSEYNSGRLHGVIVELAADHVASHQFTIG